TRATELPDGRVLVAGGRGPSIPADEQTARSGRGIYKSGPTLADAELRDRETGAATPLPPMTVSRTEYTATGLQDGRVLLVGSHAHGWQDATAELFQPVDFEPESG